MDEERVFRALADSNRRALLDALRDEVPKRLKELETVVDMSRAGVQKHLQILENAGLVLTEWRGREKLHFLNAVPVREVYERWVSRLSGDWSARLLRLKETNEEDGMSDQAQLQHMEIKQSVTIQAERSKVFASLTDDIGYWWGAPYLIGPESVGERDVILEPKLDGRLYESWGNGEGAVWGRVSYFEKDDSLEIVGTIGMSGAIHGKVAILLKDSSEGRACDVELTHVAVGFLGPQTRESYDGGWVDLLGRLKAYVEEGKKGGVRR